MMSGRFYIENVGSVLHIYGKKVFCDGLVEHQHWRVGRDYRVFSGLYNDNMHLNTDYNPKNVGNTGNTVTRWMVWRPSRRIFDLAKFNCEKSITNGRIRGEMG
jgi:hypothetical protein